MTEKNERTQAEQSDKDQDRRRVGESAEGEGAPRGTGAEVTEEFRPEPVKQRESRGQRGAGEGPQVTPGED